MKIISLNDLRDGVDRPSILVNVDTKASFERVASQSASQPDRKIDRLWIGNPGPELDKTSSSTTSTEG